MALFRNNTQHQRYELEVNEAIAFANYRIEGNTCHILHVEAPPVLRGTGAAGTLMEQVAKDLDAQNLTPNPICSYAALWYQRQKRAKS
jgi:predicted GNAT family acetyltransferase